MPAQPLNLPDTLPIARYRFTFKLTSSLHLPIYAGSTLRGVFGHALKELICTCGQPEKHQSNCPFNTIFNAPQSQLADQSQKNSPPQAYLFEPAAKGKFRYEAGEYYAFDMVLIGHSRAMLSLIISAMQHAFKKGIGSKNGYGELINLAVERNNTWQNIWHNQQIVPHNNTITLPNHYPSSLHLHFQTPLRLQYQNKILQPNEIHADTILRHAMRRVSTISQLYFPQAISADFAALSQSAGCIPSQAQFTWQHWQRYSNRQQQKMQLGGAIGSITLNQVPPEFASLLHIGQWLHIGKETVFGLGKYQVQTA